MTSALSVEVRTEITAEKILYIEVWAQAPPQYIDPLVDFEGSLLGTPWVYARRVLLRVRLYWNGLHRWCDLDAPPKNGTTRRAEPRARISD